MRKSTLRTSQDDSCFRCVLKIRNGSENDIFKKEDLFRKLDAEIRTVPGGHVGFIVQAERYLDLMETFLQRNGI